MRQFLIAFAILWASCASAFATDISITAANVKSTSSTAKISRVKFGEAVTQGQAVYKKEADGEHYKADADTGTAPEAEVVGIAITPGGDGEYGYVLTAGTMNIGATLTQGEIYVLSGGAGGVCPEGDLASNDRVTIIGVAMSTSILYVSPFVSGAKIP